MSLIRPARKRRSIWRRPPSAACPGRSTARASPWPCACWEGRLRTSGGLRAGDQINLVGTFNVIRLAAAAMSQQSPDAEGERGVIINTAQLRGIRGADRPGGLRASKAGVAGMTLPLARELARFGIRVMTIAPGTFDTPMLAGLPEPAPRIAGRTGAVPPAAGPPRRVRRSRPADH